MTIIFRTAPNPKSFGYSDGYGKTRTQGARRKSEFQHPQLNMQDKFEQGNKTDSTGILFLFEKKLNKVLPFRYQSTIIIINIIFHKLCLVLNCHLLIR